MNAGQLFSSRKAVFATACVVLLGFIGCITIPLGDPEKAKVDDKLTGAWMTMPQDDGKQTLFTVVPYDSRTSLVSEFEFSKDGDTVKPSGRLDWKMWTVDVNGTEFASLEMKMPQFAFGQEDERFAVVKLAHDGENLKIQPVKDDFVKSAKVTTPQELQDLIAKNLNNADMFGDEIKVIKVGADQKDAIGKVIDAFSEGVK